MPAAPKAANAWLSEFARVARLARGRTRHALPDAPCASVAVIARLRRSIDFERVLKTRSRAQSPHFAVHHLPGAPAVHRKATTSADLHKLSTSDAPMLNTLGDNSVKLPPTDARWLGTVVPKRHARRSVTRSLLKRQIHAAVGAVNMHLAGGLWVIRLRAPFDRSQFPSAASSVLQAAARAELDRLLTHVAQRATVA